MCSKAAALVGLPSRSRTHLRSLLASSPSIRRRKRLPTVVRCCFTSRRTERRWAEASAPYSPDEVELPLVGVSSSVESAHGADGRFGQREEIGSAARAAARSADRVASDAEGGCRPSGHSYACVSARLTRTSRRSLRHTSPRVPSALAWASWVVLWTLRRDRSAPPSPPSPASATTCSVLE
eukprot:scaffold196669_cov28-Tisochrysis_lutea.AAC.1